MAVEITRAEIWVGELEDRPGALASTLAKVMMIAGADLDFVLVRPEADSPGQSVLFVTPLLGPEQIQAARDAGLRCSDSMHALRLECPDRPGLAAGLAGTLAQADINIVGMSAAATKGNALAYLRFATEAEAEEAVSVLANRLTAET